jgi:fluoroquinolone resistance protein
MQEAYIQNKIFDRADLVKNPLEKGEYEGCVFNNCNFSEADLSGYVFADCLFSDSNLSLAKVSRTAFRNISFRNCKMLGIRIDTCLEFGISFSFENCRLSHSSFCRKKIRNTIFKNVQLQETDFSECDLTGSLFENCDLTRAVFDHTNIEKADFRTSYNYSIDPEINRVKRAKFSIQGLPGLLEKYALDIEGYG